MAAAICSIGLALGARWLFYRSVIVFDRKESMIAIRRHRLFGHRVEAIRLEDMKGVIVKSLNGKTRRAYLKHAAGETPLTVSYTPGDEAREVATFIEDWLTTPDRGPDDADRGSPET